MKIEPFQLERMQAAWENVVAFNLAESGVHALNLEEMLDTAALDEVRRVRLGYSETTGTPELRERIAALYPALSTDQITAATGSTEANFLLMWALIEPGDEVVFELPNYMQMAGLMRHFGASVKAFHLREGRAWAPDLDELESILTPKTKIIVLTNPNNPTGAILTEGEMDRIIGAAEKRGAWILADEVYQHAERVGGPTPSFWGRYDKVIVTNGLSKAYGLPGLRVGWVAAPRPVIERLGPHHDYTTICPGALSDRLAVLALTSPLREKILARTRGILTANWPVLEAWMRGQGVFEFTAPKAGAIVFARYALDINSTVLAEKIIREKSVFLAPGDLFDMDRRLRIGFGNASGPLREALARAGEVLAGLKKL